MKLLIVVLFFIVLSCTHGKVERDNIYKEYHYQVDCKIYNWLGDLVERFPGGRCSFLQDGSFVSASGTSLNFFDSNKALVWSYPKYFHHMTSVGRVEDKILGISTAEERYEGELIRVDVLMVFNIKGEVIAQKKLDKSFFDQWGIKPRKSSASWVMGMPWYVNQGLDIDKQWSHVNSFYEIPPQKKAQDEVFRSGNFIVNIKGLGLLIFDSSLEALLYFHPLQTSKNHFVHDAQVTENATILYFNNRVYDENNEGHINVHSSVDEVYPCKACYVVDGRVRLDGERSEFLKYRFPSKKNLFFISEFAGSIQEISNQHLLMSAVSLGPYIIDKVTNEVIYSNLRFIFQEKDIFQVKALRSRDYSWLE